ncbi:MAG: endolytic transglycosylase MltG [Spirochaetales bacterium]|nr:endolytic transglycosylase MltG [Spirochaetales bacterium]
MKKVTVLLIVLGVFLFGFGIGGGLLLGYLNSPPPVTEEKQVEFSVAKGESLNSIAERLEQSGIIRSKYFLIGISKWKGTERAYQAGYYLLPLGKTTLYIHDFLTTGSQTLFKVTIPEGWTCSRIGRLLESKGIVSSRDFLEASQSPELLKRYGIPSVHVEGYLFPETYLFPKEYSALKVIEAMVETFFQRISRIQGKGNSLTDEELYAKVTLASIVEREYRDAEEAPIIASVFINRLKARMPLGSCATVEYVLTEQLGRPHPDVLTYEDLEVSSPYNTYTHLGLPPGPICNPGETALHAAFYPAETDYRYFVLRDPEAGKHFFSRTLQEHMKAKVLYLKKIQPGG